MMLCDEGERVEVAQEATVPPFWRSRPSYPGSDYLLHLRRASGRIDQRVQGGPLVVSFSGLGDDPAQPNFEFQNALSPFASVAHRLFLRDSDIQWYVTRRHYFVDVIRASCALAVASRLVFVGASAGGWAALFFQSKFFPAAAALAFSPQCFLDSETRAFEEDVSSPTWMGH